MKSMLLLIVVFAATPAFAVIVADDGQGNTVSEPDLLDLVAPVGSTTGVQGVTPTSDGSGKPNAFVAPAPRTIIIKGVPLPGDPRAQE